MWGEARKETRVLHLMPSQIILNYIYLYMTIIDMDIYMDSINIAGYIQHTHRHTHMYTHMYF